jgi:MFS family permease
VESQPPFRWAFGRLVVSSGTSNLADGIAKIALPLVAVGYTRSPALVAGLELVRTMPWLIGALPVGALVDRLDRRVTMVVANIVRAALVALVTGFILAGHGSIWLLYVVALGSGVAEVFYDTAAQSFVPSIVGRADLDRANGRLFAVELGAQEFIGPPVAGVLVATSAAIAFGASAGLWVIAIIALISLRGRFRPARARGSSTLRAEVREGLAFLMSRPLLRTMALMVGMSNLASSAVFAVLVIYAVGPDSALGLTEPQFGLLFATLAAGALVGGLIAERVQRAIGRANTLTLSVVGFSSYIITLAATANIPAIATTAFVSGMTVMMWNVTTVSFRQRLTPDHLLGRLNSAYRLVAWGTRPLGAAIGGALGQTLCIRAVFIAMSLLAVAVLIPNRTITESALTAADANPTTHDHHPQDEATPPTPNS